MKNQKPKKRRIPEEVKKKFWNKSTKEERRFMEKLGLKPKE